MLFLDGVVDFSDELPKSHLAVLNVVGLVDFPGRMIIGFMVIAKKFSNVFITTIAVSK